MQRRKSNQGKPIIKYDKSGNFIEKYPSRSEAERQNNICIPMSDIKKGTQKTAGGCIWKYEEDL